MHTFMRKPVKTLKMRKLSTQEIGSAKREMISLLAPSPDPFVSIMYPINLDVCTRFIQEVSAQKKMRITITSVLNRLIGLAIAENPVYNQLVFGSSIYQLEEIHLANIVLVPGTDALTYVILRNPHHKSLEKIQQEFFLMLVNKKKEYAKATTTAADTISRFIYRFGLYLLIGEKRAFRIAYERGLMSNISLSTHIYGTPARFTMVKDVINPMNITPRFHACGPSMQPVVKNGTVTAGEVLNLHVTADHRILGGVHAHRFGMALERIAASPEKYLL